MTPALDPPRRPALPAFPRPGALRSAGARPAAAAFITLVLLALAGLTVVFVAEPVRIPSDSMAPTLRAGDHVLVDKIGLRNRSPARGDLVVFDSPAGDGLLVKRVAGVGGDQVGIEDGVLVVNGSPVAEPYLDQGRVDGLYFGPVTVPAGRLFVLGDNRADSVDSRTLGPVAVHDVVGRVLIRLWPVGGRG